MKKLFIIFCLCIMALGFGMNKEAFAIILDFESFSAGDTISGSGVFSDLEFSADSDAITISDESLNPNFGGTKSAGFTTNRKPFKADFLIENVNFISVVMGDIGYDEDVLFLEAYNNLNQLLDEITSTLESDISAGLTLSISALNIDHVIFGSTGTYPNSIYFDNFEYTTTSPPIPEPATILLLGSGLLGLIGAGFKRKKHIA